jgi:NAD(P)-dependent dehydrogenase (short-subunit alcohol dehydrogenase family)/acyl dehydratase
MSDAQPPRTIRFTPADLALFSAASHDRNPLHMSEAYAHTTPYGEPVVFGVLGGLACLGVLQDRPGMMLSSLVYEFANPIFADISYTVEVAESSGDQATAKIYDGRRIVLKMTARFQPTPQIEVPAEPSGMHPASHTAADLANADLVQGYSIDGRYAPAWDQMATLSTRFGLTMKGVALAQLATLLWASYLVGMELPGRRALFSRLALSWEQRACDDPYTYTARLRSFDRRFNLLRMDVAFACAKHLLAKGELRSFVRQDPPTLDTTRVISRANPDRLKGHVALIIGASRGLGARLAQELVWQGCTVLATFRQSVAEAETLRAQLADAPGEIVLLQGDASDLDWCMQVKAQILASYGRLDILICNACPPLIALWLDPGALQRIHEYVLRSLALVSVPMAAFLDLVAAQSGSVVVVSSSAVSAPVAEWPHYVASKGAIESLTSVAAQEYAAARFLVARLPRMLTDLTNTPAGYQDALAPEQAAAAIVDRLLALTSTGRVAIWTLDEHTETSHAG